MNNTTTRTLVYLSIIILLALDIWVVSYIFRIIAHNDSRHVALYEVTSHSMVEVEHDDGPVTTEYVRTEPVEIPGARERVAAIERQATTNTVLVSLGLILYSAFCAIVLVPRKKYVLIYTGFIVVTIILFAVFNNTYFYR